MPGIRILIKILIISVYYINMTSFTRDKATVGKYSVNNNSILIGQNVMPMKGQTSSSGGNSNYSPLSGGGNASISEITVTSQQGASDALGAIDSALTYVQAERSNLGSIQNRLTHTIDNLSNIVTSTGAAQSRIRDTDYAKETSELARTQIIQQAATAMLAQANQQPQLVLQLLQ